MKVAQAPKITESDFRAGAEFLWNVLCADYTHIHLTILAKKPELVEKLKQDGVSTNRGRCFNKTKETVSDLHNYIRNMNKVGWNIYHTVNPVSPKYINGKKVPKPSDTDIASINYMLVDLDPEDFEPTEAAHARLLKELNEPPENTPLPTFIVCSGAGYHGYWKLQDPIPLDGTKQDVEKAKRHNEGLTKLIYPASDSVFDPGRIMRTPGTINWPDSKKIDRGRKPTLASVTSTDHYAYPLSYFPPYEEAQRGSADVKPLRGAKLPPDSGLESYESIEFLIDDYGIPGRVIQIISEGSVPDEPKRGDNSRSAWLFDALCQLERFGVPDGVVASIMLDPDWKISASVLDKDNPRKYLQRQMDNAKTFVAKDAQPPQRNAAPTAKPKNGAGNKELQGIPQERINYLANRYIKLNSPPRYLQPLTAEDKGKRRIPPLWSHGDFMGHVCSSEIMTIPWGNGEKEINIAKLMDKAGLFPTYEGLIFAPNKSAEQVAPYFNTWTGLAYSPVPDPIALEDLLYLQHVRDHVAGGREDIYQYILHWMARGVQYPERRGEVAIVMRGSRGTGKTLFAESYFKLFGHHAVTITSPEHFTGRFNLTLRDRCGIFSDEAFSPNNRAAEARLKTLITGETMQVEAKGVEVVEIPNPLKIIIASNNEKVIPAGANERRFLVLQVEHELPLGAERRNYFKKIVKQLKNGGYESLLTHLLGMDLSDFDVRGVPNTKELGEQQELSLDPTMIWLYEKLQEGQWGVKGTEWEFFARRSVYNVYLEETNPQRSGSWRPLPYIQFGRLVESVLGANLRGWKGDTRGVRVPPIEEARENFTKHYGLFEVDWEEPLKRKYIEEQEQDEF